MLAASVDGVAAIQLLLKHGATIELQVCALTYRQFSGTVHTRILCTTASAQGIHSHLFKAAQQTCVVLLQTVQSCHAASALAKLPCISTEPFPLSHECATGCLGSVSAHVCSGQFRRSCLVSSASCWCNSWPQGQEKPQRAGLRSRRLQGQTAVVRQVP